MRIVDEAFWLAMGYMYGYVEEGAPECIEHVNKIYDLGSDLGLELPPANLFKDCLKRSDSQHDVWGDEFSTDPFRKWLRQEFG